MSNTSTLTADGINDLINMARLDGQCREIERQLAELRDRYEDICQERRELSYKFTRDAENNKPKETNHERNP